MAQIDFNILKNPEEADDEIRKVVRDVNDYRGGTHMDYLSEPHVACCLLVDTSQSMQSDGKIDQLNEALRTFKETVCQDPLSRMRVDVCVISFDSDVNIVITDADGTVVYQETNGTIYDGKVINITPADGYPYDVEITSSSINIIGVIYLE